MQSSHAQILVPELLSDAFDQLGKLIQHEVRLARTESSQKLTQAGMGAALLGGFSGSAHSKARAHTDQHCDLVDPIGHVAGICAFYRHGYWRWSQHYPGDGWNELS